MKRIAVLAVAALALAACDEDEPVAVTEAPKTYDPAPITVVDESGQDAFYRVGDLVIGSMNASVRVFAYESLTCPHCASFHRDLWPELKAKYADSGKVAFVFRDLPLDGVALRGSAMARCLPGQARYGVLQMMFDQQGDWARASDPVAALTALGQQAGLPAQQARECAEDAEVQTQIMADARADAERFGVQSTPSFVINDELAFRGAPAIESFMERLDDELGG